MLLHKGVAGLRIVQQAAGEALHGDEAHARLPAGLRHRGNAEKSAIFAIQSLHHPFQTVTISLCLHNSHQTVIRHNTPDDV